MKTPHRHVCGIGGGRLLRVGESRRSDGAGSRPDHAPGVGEVRQGRDRAEASCHPKPLGTELAHRLLPLRSVSWSVAGSGWPGYSTAFRAAELAAEKFSSWLVWYSFHAAESQISRWSKLPNTTHSFVSPA